MPIKKLRQYLILFCILTSMLGNGVYAAEKDIDFFDDTGYQMIFDQDFTGITTDGLAKIMTIAQDDGSDSVTVNESALRIKREPGNGPASVTIPLQEVGSSFRLEIRMKMSTGLSYTWMNFWNGNGKNGAKFRPSCLSGQGFLYKNSTQNVNTALLVQEPETYYDYVMEVNGSTLNYYGRKTGAAQFTVLGENIPVSAVHGAAKSSAQLQIYFEPEAYCDIDRLCVKQKKGQADENDIMLSDAKALLEMNFKNSSPDITSYITQGTAAAEDNALQMGTGTIFKASLGTLASRYQLKLRICFDGSNKWTWVQLWDGNGKSGLKFRPSSVGDGFRYRTTTASSDDVQTGRMIQENLVYYDYIADVKDGCVTYYGRKDGESQYTCIADSVKINNVHGASRAEAVLEIFAESDGVTSVEYIGVFAEKEKKEEYSPLTDTQILGEIEDKLYYYEAFGTDISDLKENEGWSVLGSGGDISVTGGILSIKANGVTDAQVMNLNTNLSENITISYDFRMNGGNIKSIAYFDKTRCYLDISGSSISVIGGTGNRSGSISAENGKWYEIFISVKDGSSADIYLRKKGEAKAEKIIDGVGLPSSSGTGIRFFTEGNAAAGFDIDNLSFFNGVFIKASDISCKSDVISAYISVFNGMCGVSYSRNVTAMLVVRDTYGYITRIIPQTEAVCPLEEKTFEFQAPLGEYDSTAEIYLWDTVDNGIALIDTGPGRN